MLGTQKIDPRSFISEIRFFLSSKSIEKMLSGIKISEDFPAPKKCAKEINQYL